MILQALNDYYHRKSAGSELELAPPGFQYKPIPFSIVLNEEGQFVDWDDYREITDKKQTARSFLIPQEVKKSVNIAANLLWGGLDYALGEDIKNNPNRVAKSHEAFLDKLRNLLPLTKSDDGLIAVIKFLESSHRETVKSHGLWPEVLKATPNISFRLASDACLVCQRQAIKLAIENSLSQEDIPDGWCLITGENSRIERLHPAIKGVSGSRSTGANIVAFNQDAFCSFGKDQGSNSPIGIKAVFAYTTALNHLLRKGSPQKIIVGDATTIFWAEKNHSCETLLTELFGHPPKDDPDRNTLAVRSLYESPRTGAPPINEDETKFFVLGLSPNGPRLSIRYWLMETIGRLANNFRLHFDDITMVHSKKEPEHLSLWQLLVAIALQGKSENIPPNLAGEVMQSILAGSPYPRLLLQATVGRIQAEHHISYPRAAWIKAFLNRYTRWYQPNEKEVTVSLDENNSNTAYRLGRLFAILEKLQQEALPGISATIRDRYYGSASSTPARAFSSLLKLKNHHLGKLEHQGRAINFEKMMGNVLQDVSDFPAVLSLEDQGRFALGYYHQRHQLFQKANSNEKGEE